MRPPFWIVNLGLLLLAGITFAFVTVSRVTLPKRSSIKPESVALRKEQQITINIKKIYEKDLFGTYEKEIPQPKKVDIIKPLPPAPQTQNVTVPKAVEPEFLPPLNITLKGIIVVGTNDAKNRTIIQGNTTSQEVTYKVGDTLQDAQLIRIFKNKIILLRITGQQEVLYLREQDAKLDPVYTLLDGWETIIQKMTDTRYTVNPSLFAERIKNLAQFIDLLNITTAYQKGESIGLFIGTSLPNSLGNALGLETKDLIEAINNMPVRTTQERLDAYKKIISLTPGDTVVVKLQRKGKTIEITYALEAFKKVEEEAKNEKPENQASTAFYKHNDAMQQHHAFAPTIDKMRKSDRRIMTEKNKSSLRTML